MLQGLAPLYSAGTRLLVLGVPVYRLPSSSPANATWSFERKLQAWREVFKQAGLAVIG